MRTRRKKDRKEKATPDLTPMIDVTFQLLIFFILCTRFVSPEEFHRADLPKNEGDGGEIEIPKEQITIYCMWDEAVKANSYVVAMDARGRIPVEGSLATLDDLVIYPKDTAESAQRKKANYQRVFDNLVTAIEAYVRRSGASIEKLEIAFANNSMVGAASGTAPWMFVSAALDACVRVNEHRHNAKQEPYSVTFKFADVLGAYR